MRVFLAAGFFCCAVSAQGALIQIDYATTGDDTWAGVITRSFQIRNLDLPIVLHVEWPVGITVAQIPDVHILDESNAASLGVDWAFVESAYRDGNYLFGQREGTGPGQGGFRSGLLVPGAAGVGFRYRVDDVLRVEHWSQLLADTGTSDIYLARHFTVHAEGEIIGIPEPAALAVALVAMLVIGCHRFRYR